MSDQPAIPQAALDGAWSARENAKLYGTTQVGSAAVASDGAMTFGCNVEHRFRAHDIHAEQNAIGSFVSSGHDELVLVVVVAERERFSPCGSCMDWIFEVGGPACRVAFQSSRGGPISEWTAEELMPLYPF